MRFTADNAVILAAGTASRFAPISYEMPKALIPVRGEVLIERQIRQLKESGVPEIFLVVGYKKDAFAYLTSKFGVKLIENNEYLTRNNNASLYVARHVLHNTYVCSSDNYFTRNPFESAVDAAYYAAVYADGPTAEWCVTEDADGCINHVQVGGSDTWIMLGHTFWDAAFSKTFLSILEEVYDRPETAPLLWESIYMQNLDKLHMRIRKYPPDVIYEFDTLDELRMFDPAYLSDTHSAIVRSLAQTLCCRESEMSDFTAYKDGSLDAAGFSFCLRQKKYLYLYATKELRSV